MASSDGQQLDSWKVDASANGCTGMFWRTKPEMSASGGGSDWPRNGTVLKGTASSEHEGWVQFDNGYWLPMKQHGKQILFKVE